MPYTFKEATDEMNIQMNEYASAEIIQFSHFDSCIGVIVARGTEVTGLHLDTDGLDSGTIQNAIQIIKAKGKYNSVAIIGCVDALKDSNKALYKELKEGIRPKGIVDKYKCNKGVYTVTTKENFPVVRTFVVDVTKNGNETIRAEPKVSKDKSSGKA